MVNSRKPYFSVVVASRNDNHGGDLRQRMQTFVDSLAELSDRHSLPIELLIVEWNPPSDHPRLAESLQWPTSSMCDYRIVEVPADLHEQYQVCGRELPLFQMIAKNVGVRRARADFVLATNLDLIFSDELMRWLATRPLEEGTHYRVDRYDVPLEVMNQTGLDAQLDYSRDNVLRINSCFGTFDPDCFLRDDEGNLTYSENDEAFALLAQLHCDLPRDVLRACKHWNRSQSFFREAIHERSVGRFASAIRYGAKAGIRHTKNRAKIVKLSARLAFQKRFSFGRAPRMSPYDDTLIHTNACGDFTLLAKTDWLRLRGYAEFEMYSWHLDSLFLYCANYAGINQQVLPYPIYHIEHTGGWTPENSDKLFSRLTAAGTPFLTNDDLERFRKVIEESPQPYCFNGDSWGLDDQSLPDYPIMSGGAVTARVA